MSHKIQWWGHASLNKETWLNIKSLLNLIELGLAGMSAHRHLTNNTVQIFHCGLTISVCTLSVVLIANREMENSYSVLF